MNKESNFITKDETNIIKGIAIIFMFIHHFFCYPNWYINGISYPYLTKFAKIFVQPFNPVGIFAFLTGYTYFYSKNKNFKYSLKKITDVLIPFWTVLTIILIIGLCTNTYTFSIKSFILEMFGIKRSLMNFCWYIYFYITIMIFLPLIYKILDKGIYKALFYGIILPIIVFKIFNGFASGKIYKDAFTEIARWIPCVTSGYIVSKYSLFNKLKELLPKNNILKMLFVIALFIVSFMLKCLVPYLNFGEVYSRWNYVTLNLYLNFIYDAIIIFTSILIFRNIPKIINKLFINIGKMSLLMWFIHCIFFNTSKEIFMLILFMPKEPILVLIWGLLICYLLAFILNFLITYILKIKNNIFNKLITLN